MAEVDDFAEIEQALVEHHPRLVILDPIVAYLGAKTDAYRANEVRAILAPLARLAERHGCAVLAVRHLNKSRGSRSIYAGQGSIDFTAAARSVLLAGCGAAGEVERALVHIKSNLAGVGPTLAYTIDEQGFRWAGASSLRASDLLAPESTGNDLSSLKLPCPVVRRPTRLEHDESRLPLGEEPQELTPGQPVRFGHRARAPRDGDLEDALCQVNSDGRRLHGGLLLSIPPATLAHRCRT
ncbi:MAG TPA: AAA family ATPase [Thermoanaerobaculia bacterium]|nr:AAA family ATPase [Thermoanaerobaculia bacterium]